MLDDYEKWAKKIARHSRSNCGQLNPLPATVNLGTLIKNELYLDRASMRR